MNAFWEIYNVGYFISAINTYVSQWNYKTEEKWYSKRKMNNIDQMLEIRWKI